MVYGNEEVIRGGVVNSFDVSEMSAMVHAHDNDFTVDMVSPLIFNDGWATKYASIIPLADVMGDPREKLSSFYVSLGVGSVLTVFLVTLMINVAVCSWGYVCCMLSCWGHKLTLFRGVSSSFNLVHREIREQDLATSRAGIMPQCPVPGRNPVPRRQAYDDPETVFCRDGCMVLCDIMCNQCLGLGLAPRNDPFEQRIAREDPERRKAPMPIHRQYRSSGRTAQDQLSEFLLQQEEAGAELQQPLTFAESGLKEIELRSTECFRGLSASGFLDEVHKKETTCYYQQRTKLREMTWNNMKRQYQRDFEAGFQRRWGNESVNGCHSLDDFNAYLNQWLRDQDYWTYTNIFLKADDSRGASSRVAQPSEERRCHLQTVYNNVCSKLLSGVPFPSEVEKKFRDMDVQKDPEVKLPLLFEQINISPLRKNASFKTPTIHASSLHKGITSADIRKLFDNNRGGITDLALWEYVSVIKIDSLRKAKVQQMDNLQGKMYRLNEAIMDIYHKEPVWDDLMIYLEKILANYSNVNHPALPGVYQDSVPLDQACDPYVLRILPLIQAGIHMNVWDLDTVRAKYHRVFDQLFSYHEGLHWSSPKPFDDIIEAVNKMNSPGEIVDGTHAPPRPFMSSE